MNSAHAATLEEATSTGIPSAKLGMWLFLASEIMFFAGLFATYVVLRMGHPAWPGPEGHLSVPLGTINTFVLICSSASIGERPLLPIPEVKTPMRPCFFSRKSSFPTRFPISRAGRD